MKIIPKKIHGVIDYVTVVTLLAAPYLFGFADLGGAAVWVPRLIAMLVLGLSLFTDYELSLSRVVPMKVHVMMDMGASLLLTLSPFLFGFYDNTANVWMPHVVVGVGYFIVSVMTQTENNS